MFSRVYVLPFIGIPLSVVVFGSIVCFVVFSFNCAQLFWFVVFCESFVVLVFCFLVHPCFSVVFLRVSVDILLLLCFLFLSFLLI